MTMLSQKLDTIQYKLHKIFHYKDRFIFRVKNLIRWFPIIWEDNDYDWAFFLAVIEAKAKFMADHFEDHNLFVGVEDVVVDIRRVQFLAKKLADDEYLMAERPAGMEFKEFYEAADKAQHDDLVEMCELIKEKLFTWWD